MRVRAWCWWLSLLVLAWPSPLRAQTDAPAGSYRWSVASEWAWDEIGETGAAIPLAGDGISNPIPVGHNFFWFGSFVSFVHVGANGFVSFLANQPSGNTGVAALPSASGPNAIIAPYWTDLSIPPGASVRYRVLGSIGARRMVVQWTGVTASGAAPATFQVVLHEGTNDFEIRCLRCPATSSARATGYEDSSGTSGGGLAFGTAATHDTRWYVSAAGTEIFPGTSENLGPDAFGYRASRVDWGFFDIRAATRVTLADDAVSPPIPIGFPYNFYGRMHSEVFLSSNGLLAFANSPELASPASRALPSTAAGTPHGFIAAFWADLDPASGGTITYATTGVSPNRRFVAQWTEVPQRPSGEPVTVQVMLYESNGAARVRCVHCSTGNPAVIGFEDPTGTRGLMNRSGNFAIAGVQFQVLQLSASQMAAPALAHGGPYTAPEGTTVTFTGSCNPACDTAGGRRYGWDLDGNGAFDALAAVTAQPAGGGPATRSVRFGSCGTEGCSWATTTLTVVNLPPAFTTTPSRWAGIGLPYSYQAVATDLDPVTYTLVEGPGSVEPATGLVTWTPGGLQEGLHTFTLRASDGQGGVTDQSWVIEVGPQAGFGPWGYEIHTPGWAWDDISASGVPVPLANGATSGAIPIGFAFPFYGRAYTSFTVSDDGYLSFVPGGGFVAAYRADLDPSLGGRIAYATLGVAPDRRLVVEWTDVDHAPSGNASTFQIVLHEGLGDIDLRCLDCRSDGSVHITGIEGRPGLGSNVLGPGDYSLAMWRRVIVAAGLAVDVAAPYTSFEGDPFDATAACVGCTTIEWDLDGDGTFETGPTFTARVTGADGPRDGMLAARACNGFGACAVGVSPWRVENRAPRITTTATRAFGFTGGAHILDHDAEDVPLDTLTWTLPTAPAGMTIDAAGRVAWTPSTPGTFDVVVRATDDDGAFDEHAYQVVVDILGAGGPYRATEGTTITLAATCPTCTSVAWDLDGDGAFERAGASVPFAGIDGPAAVVVTARGCVGLDCQVRAATVIVDEAAPRFYLRSETIDAGVLYRRQGIAEDLDGLAVVTLLEGPTGMTALESSSGTVWWTAPTAGVHTVRISAQDQDGAVSELTYTLTVRPILFPTGNLPVTVQEMAASALTATCTGCTRYEWDFENDGVFEPGTNPISFTAPDGPATFMVGVRGCAGTSNAACDTELVRVDVLNRAPTFGSSPPSRASVGVPYSHNFAPQDPSPVDSVTLSLLSGPPGMSLTGIQLSWPAPAPGNWSVTVRVADDDGDYSGLTYSLRVAPVVTNDAPANVNEGTSVLLTNTCTGCNAFIGWDLDANGTFEISGTTATFNARDGAMSAIVTARGCIDTLFNCATVSRTINILNVPPVISPYEGPTTAIAGVPYATQLLAADAAGTYDPLVWSVTQGPAGLTVAANGAVSWPSPVAGSHPITVRVSDGDFGTAQASWTLTVIGLVIGGPFTVDEGTGVPLAATCTGCTRLEWDLDGDGVYEIASANTTFAAGGGPATRTVTARACDGAGTTRCVSRSTTVTVDNVAPRFTTSPPVLVFRGAPVAYTPAVTDFDPLTFTLAAGPAGMTIDPATGAITWQAAWLGLHDVQIVAQDGATSTTQRFDLQVVRPIPGATLFPETTPAAAAPGTGSPVEVGLRFSAARDGEISAVRFYRPVAGTLPIEVVNLWSTSGTLIATASQVAINRPGWREVGFATPVQVAAGQTYVASYHSADGLFGYTLNGYQTPITSGDLTGLTGVYRFGGVSGYPANLFSAANYWVDVVYSPGYTRPPLEPAETVLAVAPGHVEVGGPGAVEVGLRFRASVRGDVAGIRYYRGPGGGPATPFSLWTGGGALLSRVSAETNLIESWHEVRFAEPVPIEVDKEYVASYHAPLGRFGYSLEGLATPVTSGSLTAVRGVYGYGPAGTFPSLPAYRNSNYWVSVLFIPRPDAPPAPSTIFGMDPPSGTTDASGPPVVVGVTFRSDVSGALGAVRLHRASAGPVTVGVWTPAGVLLGTATGVPVLGRGWRELALATPVRVEAGQTYVASYQAPDGVFAYTYQGLSAPFSAGYGLTALGSLYRYGSGFPNLTYAVSNYWVDVSVVPYGAQAIVTDAAFAAVEGAPRTFDVRLAAAPRGTVSVTVTIADPEAASVSPALLTFDAASWSTPQAVTITGVPDADRLDEQTTVTLTSWAAPVASVPVAITDDDMQEILVGATRLAPREGGSVQLAVSLAAMPAADVAVSVVSANPAASAVSPAVLSFTPANFDLPQQVTVSGVEDEDLDPAATLVFLSTPGAGDVAVPVDVVEDDVQALLVTGAPLSLQEGGPSRTIAVRLRYPPRGASDVVRVTTGDAARLEVFDPAGGGYAGARDLTFTRASFATPQDLAVRGAVDADTVSDVITLELRSQSEPAAAQVAVTVLDQREVLVGRRTIAGIGGAGEVAFGTSRLVVSGVTPAGIARAYAVTLDLSTSSSPLDAGDTTGVAAPGAMVRLDPQGAALFVTEAGGVRFTRAPLDLGAIGAGALLAGAELAVDLDAGSYALVTADGAGAFSFRTVGLDGAASAARTFAPGVAGASPNLHALGGGQHVLLHTAGAATRCVRFDGAVPEAGASEALAFAAGGRALASVHAGAAIVAVASDPARGLFAAAIDPATCLVIAERALGGPRPYLSARPAIAWNGATELVPGRPVFAVAYDLEAGAGDANTHVVLLDADLAVLSDARAARGRAPSIAWAGDRWALRTASPAVDREAVVTLTTGSFGPIASCGDGLVQAPESCDDGGTAGGDGCSGTCAIDAWPTDRALPVVDVYGSVQALEEANGVLYLGGTFRYLGPETGNFATFDASTAAVAGSWPRYHGTLSAIVADGAGGWFIGGYSPALMRHLNADGSADEAYPLAVTGDVRALARSGDTLYLAGVFTAVNGQPRRNLASFDLATRTLTSWDPSPDGAVRELLIEGGIVYAAGDFANAGGAARTRLAAIDASSGAPLAFDPSPNGDVNALAVHGGRLYAGGTFTTIAGAPRTRLASFDLSTGAITTWAPSANEVVFDLAATGGAIYAGGWFTAIGAVARDRIAAIDAVSGALLAFNPTLGSGQDTTMIHELLVDGDTLYAGGRFIGVSGEVRASLARFDLTAGQVDAWRPMLDGGDVRALAVWGGRVAAGGDFHSAGGVERNRIAAVDLGTRQVLPWNPVANSGVTDLLLAGDTLYAAGNFTAIGGAARNRIAALDVSSGAVTAWNPNASNSVQALALRGDTIYAGGDFAGIGGQTRGRIAALDTTTGAATAWTPGAIDIPGASVNAILLAEDTVYVGGFFEYVGGVARANLFEASLATGALTPFSPQMSSAVQALARDGDTIYAGGFFRTVNGTGRRFVAALDRSGALLPWDPDPDDYITSFALADGVLFASGASLTRIAGQPRLGIAAFDRTTRALLPFDPRVSYPLALMARGDHLFAGTIAGSSIGGVPHYGLGAFDLRP